MPPACIVKGCKNRPAKDRNYKFFVLPWKDDALCREWLRLAGRNREMGEESTLRFKKRTMCSRHFEDKDQARKGLPTLFLPGVFRNKCQWGSSWALTILPLLGRSESNMMQW